MGGSIGKVVGGIGGGLLGGGGKDKSSGGNASQAASVQSWQDIERANALNRSNAEWTQQQNQQSMDQALGQNRANQISDFGQLAWNRDPTTGAWTQTNRIAPGLSTSLDAVRGKYKDMVEGMGGGFDTNSAVLQALRGQMQPGLDEARGKENARLAAMGLNTGSGSAWGSAQDALNRSQNDAEQKAILGAFQADQALRQSNRSDLGALAGLESTWNRNMQMPSFAQAQGAQMGQPVVAAPGNRTYEAAMADAQGKNAQAASWGKFGGALGEAAGNWIEDWWNKPSSTGSGDSGWGSPDPNANYGGIYDGNQSWD